MGEHKLRGGGALDDDLCCAESVARAQAALAEEEWYDGGPSEDGHCGEDERVLREPEARDHVWWEVAAVAAEEGERADSHHEEGDGDVQREGFSEGNTVWILSDL